MDRLEQMTTYTTPFDGGSLKPFFAALVFLAASVLQAGAQEQACPPDAIWPTCDYDGKPAQEVGVFTKAMVPGSRTDTARYAAESRTMTSADGRLQIRLDCKKYKQHAAEEYAVRLTNLSKTEPTGIASNFRSLALSVSKPEDGKAPVLHVLRGSTMAATDFIPEAFALEAGKERVLTTTCGRSSNDYIPFLELDIDDRNGYLFAVGWTGSWKARFVNTGKRLTSKSAWTKPTSGSCRRNDPPAGHPRFYPQEPNAPRVQDALPPVHAREQSPARFQRTGDSADPGGRVRRREQDAADDGRHPALLRRQQDAVRHVWVDAGWCGAPHEDELFSNCGPHWWKYVGDWRVNTTVHPTGDLLPIADAVHKAGLKFLLWFEPERMTDSGRSCRRIRSTVTGSSSITAIRGPLMDSGYGLRNDREAQDRCLPPGFQHGPGPVWREMDAPERIGIAEAKHIDGLYTFLDDMRGRFPDILQENCASGGRRIDLEMNARAHVYCRSDYFIGQKPNDTAFILGQNATLNLTPYLPFQGCEFNCVPVGDDYAAFSIISSGTVITPSDFDGGIIRRAFSGDETAWFKKVFDVAARMRPFYMGDFYHLTDETGAGNDIWCAWQCDRPDLKAGFAVFFRRGAAAEAFRTFRLGGIAPDAEYELDVYGGSQKTVKSSELEMWSARLEQRSFQLLFYKKR
jgi:alpha-galactosidase